MKMGYLDQLRACYERKASEEEREILHHSDVQFLSDDEILRILRESNGKVESVAVPDAGEQSLIVQSQQGRMFYYDTYICQIREKDLVLLFRKHMKKMAENYPQFRTLLGTHSSGQPIRLVLKKADFIHIKDISGEEEEEQWRIVSYNLQTARRRQYRPDRNLPFLLQVLKLGEDRYIAMFLVCPDRRLPVSIHEIFDELLPAYSRRDLLDDREKEKNKRVRSFSYWKDTLSPAPGAIPGFQKKNVRSMESVIYEMDEELSDILTRFIRANQVSVRSFFTAVWGLLLCKRYGLEQTLIGIAHEPGRLGILPVRIESRKNVVDVLKGIQQQMRDAAKNDGISLEELQENVGFTAARCIPLVQNFLESTGAARLEEEFAGRTIYHFAPFHVNGMPMTVFYFLSPNTMRLQYDYDKDLFGEEEIEQLQSSFIGTLRGVLKAFESRMPEAYVPEEARRADKAKITAQKALYLKQSGLFGALTMEELLKLAEGCLLRGYLTESIVQEMHTPADHLYIVGEGRIEIARTDREQYLRTLGILKEGAVFGIESMQENRATECSYVVCSETAKTVLVPKKLLAEYSKRFPSILQGLLARQTADIVKYQNLWMME